MDADEAIRQRASVRSYGNANVDSSVVKELIELDVQAPSAGNSQEWVFVVVRDQNVKKALAES